MHTALSATAAAPCLAVNWTEMVSHREALVRFGGDQARYDATYAGAKPVQPEDIAETLFWIATLPPHLNINRIEVMPVRQSFAGFQVAREG